MDFRYFHSYVMTIAEEFERSDRKGYYVVRLLLG